jgi:hypothetical protein
VTVLARTPGTLTALLRGLPDGWAEGAAGPGTWGPYVIGHLIHGERARQHTGAVGPWRAYLPGLGG